MIQAFLHSPSMSAALWPASLIAMITASLSVMVLAHRLSFLTVGVSHATLAGVGLAITLSWPLLPTAAITATIVAIFLAWMPRGEGLNVDAGTGVLFAGAMALGLVLTAHAPSAQVDLFGLLFGNILMVSGQDMFWMHWGAGLILLSMLIAARTWWSIAFDDMTAAARGVPVQRYRLALYAIVGIAVVLCVRLAGIVLTAGMLILPAATVWPWSRGLVRLWVGSVLTSLLATWSGLFLSYAEDWPSGASIILVLCLFFLVGWGLHRLVGR